MPERVITMTRGVIKDTESGRRGAKGGGLKLKKKKSSEGETEKKQKKKDGGRR